MFDALIRKRLFNHFLSHRHFNDITSAVAHFGAVQAQEYDYGLWAVGLRMGSASESGIEQAIADRQIVRSWTQRGTLHLIAAEDIRWWLASAGQAQLSRYASYFKRLEIDDALYGRARDELVRLLEGGAQLTRKEIYTGLEAVGIPLPDLRGQFILLKAASDGVICFGSRRGKQLTLTLLDEWLPAAPKRSHEEATIEAARRYLRSHGPATLHDFAWWSGFRMADVRAAFDALMPTLEEMTVDGISYWDTGEEPPADHTMTGAHLLPFFDEYFVGYKERSAALDACQRAVKGRSSDLLNPTFIVNGRAIGNWKRLNRGNSVTVALTPFADISAPEIEAFHAEVQRYGAFLGLSSEGSIA